MTTNLSNIEPTKTVYGFTYPETKKVVDDLWEEKPHYLYEGVTTAWQDSFHEKLLSNWQKATENVLDTTPFSNQYVTNGSSEAIREVISLNVAQDRGKIHIFDGEYEGYDAYASGLGASVKRHDRENWDSLKSIKRGECFFLSEPHSRDGNWWDRREEFLNLMTELGVRVHLDLTYLGTGSLRKVPLTNAVETVFFSLSKVYGVYYHRIGGCFSREPIPNLYGNKWFKNMFSIELGSRLLEQYPLGDLPQKYRSLQVEAVKHLGCEASDVIMLAHDKSSFSGTYTRMTKDNASYNRYCLTPFLEALTR